MLFSVVSVVVLLFSALLALIFNRSALKTSAVGASGAVIASLTGLIPVVKTLIVPARETLSLPCSLPVGSFSFVLDPLAAFFLVPVFILTAAAALYGVDYLKQFDGKKPLGLAWAMFNVLSASMVVVILSADAVPFLIGWEAMAAASFALVIFEHEKSQVRKAGIIYLVAGGAGALFLLAMFALFGIGSDSLAFSSFTRPAGGLASVAFLCAIMGFGLKAGFVPLHIWLPEAHPAAPSHVSAVMSGVMIKMGIYGLMRALHFLTPWQPWWGWLLITIGVVSGLLGVIFALAQHDLKRLLAYSSIENIGIITLGLGIGVLGVVKAIYPLAALGFAGALLHVVNHALFKGLLFMGAGAVLHAAGTAELEALGGLSKKMPRTAVYFLVGAAAIAGLPPLNGFVSEFFICFGAFTALRAPIQTATGAVLTIAVMAAIGTLASACFAKAFGAVFLGKSRSLKCAAVHEAGPWMGFAMGVLAAACVFIGFASPLLVAPLSAAIACGFGPRLGLEFSAAAGIPLLYISAGALTLAAVLALITVFRKFLLRGRKPAAGPTWDCGYAAPSARMQYGASSFVQPLTDFFQPMLRTQRHYSGLKGFFPAGADFHTEANSVFYNHLYAPAANLIKRLAFRYSWLQHGRLQLYILYIVVALIALLVCKL
ncbi:MAG: hypothetical protein A2270_04285 [Elusimicrobia bacterium RIFOXYA12_FULL_51_18]|nr:MAG: hypothetical protein A2270_04285 [Elusimicrobia bacterium RIFOXYA12_FULL_51_18]OGS30065.1 MAG: hypothetical protein A2218_13040 [Elusimicrobia bacterium RIFOXYA2_FULL_53_38]